MILALLKNGIRFRLLKALGMPVKPQALSLEITHRCIARCVMCNIWKIPDSVPDLSLEDWLEVLSSRLFSHLVELDITGGEPFLREDLSGLISGACDFKRIHLRKLHSIALTTNGLLTERIASSMEEILERCAASNIQLVIVVAMDAVGELHDRIRRVYGAWERAHATLGFLKGLRTKFPNLILGVKTTILPMNVDQLDAISEYAGANGFFTIISPCIVTEGRYLNPEKAASLRFDSGQIQKIVRFFENEMSGWGAHSRSLLKFYKTGTMKKPCSCGFNYLFIRSDGAVHLCPLMETPVGNVLETPVHELYFSSKARRFRRRVGREPQCRICTEPGLERYSLLLEGFTYLRMRLGMGKAGFEEMHRHLGLDKYQP